MRGLMQRPTPMNLLSLVRSRRNPLPPLSTLRQPSCVRLLPRSFSFQSPSSFPFLSSASSITSDLFSKDIAASFKEWFRSRDPTIFDVISRIVFSSGTDANMDAALSRLNLHLSEVFVLQVLAHLRSGVPDGDVLPCLRFFDWAGRQHSFHHSRATFHAIFKILSRARLMAVMDDWLHYFASMPRTSSFYRIRFNDTLVMGYAVAGKPERALQILAKMRFCGLDIDSFTYHVLLNAFVEEESFDVADTISKQISLRGFENQITHCIQMKRFCKQNRIQDAISYLQQLDSASSLDEHIVGVIVNALCKMNHFQDACTVVEQYSASGKVPAGPTYNSWIRGLVDAGKVDDAFEFFQSKKNAGGFVPETVCYNRLIFGLLRENKLLEAYDLLVEMREDEIIPDKVTMNAAMCFFCKSGIVDVAIELYSSRLEFGLMPNSLAYNHLINALCGDGSIDEACWILEDSLKQGYFPGRKTFEFLTDVLCREGKLDKMSKLLDIALERNIKPSNAIYLKYISALCKAGKVDESYSVVNKLNKPVSFLNERTYANLIFGFSQLNRGDMAVRLLLDMQDSGYNPGRSLYRTVICCLCKAGHIDQVLNLLELHLTHDKHDIDNCHIFNCFIDGAGHAGEARLAGELFERMLLRGIRPSMDTNILMLQSYLKSKHISSALNFFSDLASKHKPNNRLYNIMIVGLCKVGKLEHALGIWSEVREKGMIPSLHCYEEIVHALCSSENYEMAVKVLKDFQKTGRQVSSFIFNVLLLHTLKRVELNRAWIKFGDGDEGPQSLGSSMLGHLIGAFSGGIRVREYLERLEEVLEQIFPIDIYTCNMLIRGLTMEDRMDYACDFFHRICKKGYQPNRWTYDIIVHGFCRQGRRKEAESWMEEMYRKGFYPTCCTMDKYNGMETRGG